MNLNYAKDGHWKLEAIRKLKLGTNISHAHELEELKLPKWPS